jgi:hypothetical protein
LFAVVVPADRRNAGVGIFAGADPGRTPTVRSPATIGKPNVLGCERSQKHYCVGVDGMSVAMRKSPSVARCRSPLMAR